MSSQPHAEVRHATVADVDQVAALHASRISEGFLAMFGPKFLARLYGRIVRSPVGILTVADGPSGSPAGFAAAAVSTRRLYREFLARDALAVGVAAIPTMVRFPRRVFETLRYGLSADEIELPDAEILAVAVTEAARGRGLGSRLTAAALADLSSKGAGSVRVVTAVGNEPALQMYQRLGFEIVSRTEVHAGIAQEILVWR